MKSNCRRKETSEKSSTQHAMGTRRAAGAIPIKRSGSLLSWEPNYFDGARKPEIGPAIPRIRADLITQELASWQPLAKT